MLRKQKPRVIVSLLILVSLAACATSSPAPQNDFCAIAEPIRLLDSEWAMLSRESTTMISRHNAAGEAVCGW